MTKDPKISKLHAWRERARMGGGPERIASQHAKGKLTARERLDLLLDEGTFNEIEPFRVTLDQAVISSSGGEEYLGDGVVTGYGQIDGRPVYVYAQDFTVYGGALGEMQANKITRIMDLALRNGAPIIGLIDSGGARIQEGVWALGGYAELMRRNAQYSGVIPQISLVLGPCAGGAAYSPVLTDVIIMVEKESYMFLTGPDVIQTVTGEKVDTESLGGTSVHMDISGTAHLSTTNEEEALALCRQLFSYFPSNNVENPPFINTGDDPLRMDERLNSIIPDGPGQPYSMHEVIELVMDQGTFLELKPTWAMNAITGFARIGGHSVGVVAQEPDVMAGVLDIDSADKIARFVRMCDCFNIPIVTFVDCPGFLPGLDQEHRGVIRHGAKILYAYSEATVPKVTIITRKAYGGAYVVMSSKYIGTDISLAWPTAEVAVMGAEGAVNVLYRKQIAQAADPQAERKRLEDEYREKFNNPYYAARAGIVDDIIEPKESRPKIVAALAALHDKHSTAPLRKHGNIPF
ncbi:MAG TPA: acyl-CoA carboxylase subunit beta [Anaerolineales bacterium]|nr:acyl-CoA carboxylase subunit beta [Anaerolineales bacterium]